MTSSPDQHQLPPEFDDEVEVSLRMVEEARPLELQDDRTAYLGDRGSPREVTSHPK